MGRVRSMVSMPLAPAFAWLAVSLCGLRGVGTCAKLDSVWDVVDIVKPETADETRRSKESRVLQLRPETQAKNNNGVVAQNARRVRIELLWPCCVIDQGYVTMYRRKVCRLVDSRRAHLHDGLGEAIQAIEGCHSISYSTGLKGSRSCSRRSV